MEKAQVKKLIDAERVRALYQNLPMTLVAAAVGAAATAYPFFGVLPAWRVGGWLTVVLVTVSMRLLWGVLAYRRAGAGQIAPSVGCGAL